MTLVSNSFTSYDAIGNREDLTDFIYNISPMACPFMDSIPTASATAVKHEWQTEALDAPGDNVQLEGDQVTAAESATATTRLDNICQISRKLPSVTGTQEVVNKAGRKSELKHQILKRSKELKRDIEHELLDNNAKNAGNTSTARQLAGVEAWFATNTNRGANGADPAGTGADTATDGDQRAFTESQVKDVLRKIYDSGGDPDIIMVGPTHKQTFSTFTGNATRMINATEQELNAAIFVYRSDYGDLQVVTDRFMRGHAGAGIRSALILQKDMWALAWLRRPFIKDIPLAGDAETRMILGEYTLEARNEASSGIVADLS